MIKEFEINDILNAVNSISKIEKKNNHNIQNKKSALDKNNNLSVKKQIKPSGEILVLNEMIE
jgi:hypothetical protein